MHPGYIHSWAGIDPTSSEGYSARMTLPKAGSPGALPVGGALLITGASRGIGRAVAELAGERGYRVAVNYHKQESAARSVVHKLQQSGAHAVAIQADVSNESQVVQLFETAQAELGTITHVVNNAGVVAPLLPLAECGADRLRRLLEVNVYGALLVARETARRLSTARGGPGGALVNVSSIASRLGSPGEYVDYAATKGAIDSLTIGLARELAREGVRVNAVRPGLIDTEIHTDSGMPERAFRLGAQTPLGRPGSALEVARAVLWLLGPESSYVTGALVDVSGGR